MRAIKVNEWHSEDGTKTRWYCTLEDGTECVSFSVVPENEELTGWTLEPPKQEGWKPMLRRPKSESSGTSAGRIAAAYRNTEAGARLEVLARAANTAVMQARKDDEGRTDLRDADRIYKWLIKASGAAIADGGGDSPTRAAPDPQPVAPAQATGHKRDAAAGAGDPSNVPTPAAPRCPNCTSDQIAYAPARKSNVCLACEYEWAPAAG